VEDYIFEMLKIMHEYNTMEYRVLSEMYGALHYVKEDFNRAFETLKESNLLIIKPGDAEDDIVLKITPSGKAEYVFENKLRHAGFAQSLVERSANIAKDRLQEINARAAEKQLELLESQVRLTPFIEEANISSVNTNLHTRQTNQILVVVFFFIGVFAMMSVIFSFLSYRAQDEKNNIKKDSEGGQVQYEMQNRLLKEKDNIISHQAFVIDSLKANLMVEQKISISKN
jgi:hypothetical protein